MKRFKKSVLVLFCLGIFASCGKEKEVKKMDNLKEETPIKVGLVLSTGGLGDKSFNDSAYRGIEMAEDKLGVTVKYVEPASPSEDEQFLKEYAEANYNLVIATGFQMADAVKKVATEYPKIKFVLVDSAIDLPNMVALTFREDEGSFLVGAVAAMMSKTDVVGFVGGMDVPQINKFRNGFEEGAKYVKPNIKVLVSYIGGNNPFNDPVKGKENTYAMINGDADVIYHAAAASGAGIFEAVKEKGIYAIGVDSNQDDVAKGYVLTSMVKNVDKAVFETIKEVKEGNYKAGIKVLGVAQDGVGTTNFEFTKDIIGAEKLARLEEIKNKIKSGEIKVGEKQN